MSKIEKAEKRAKKDFYWHVTVFVIVNTGLIITNLVASSDTLWFFWPLLGWGIGLLFHALSTFVFQDWADEVEDSAE